MGSPRSLTERARSPALVSFNPFVAGLSTDSEGPTPLGYRPSSLQKRGNKHHLLIHRTGLLPWHGQHPPCRLLPMLSYTLLPMLPVQNGTYLPGLYPGHRDHSDRLIV